MQRLTPTQLRAAAWCLEQAALWRGSLDPDDWDAFDRKIQHANDGLAIIRQNNRAISKDQLPK